MVASGVSCSSLSAARDQAHAVAVPLKANTLAVIFDLVEPLRAGRHAFAERGEAELELKHGPKIGIWLAKTTLYSAASRLGK